MSGGLFPLRSSAVAEAFSIAGIAFGLACAFLRLIHFPLRASILLTCPEGLAVAPEVTRHALQCSAYIVQRVRELSAIFAGQEALFFRRMKEVVRHASCLDLAVILWHQACPRFLYIHASHCLKVAQKQIRFAGPRLRAITLKQLTLVLAGIIVLLTINPEDRAWSFIPCRTKLIAIGALYLNSGGSPTLFLVVCAGRVFSFFI